MAVHRIRRLETRTLALLLISTAFLAASGLAASGILQSDSGDLVAEYRFEEGGGDVVYDSSENENDGSFTNYVDRVQSDKGRALNFTVDENYVSISDSNSLDIDSEITMSAWVNPDSCDERGTVATKGGAYYFQVHSNCKVAAYTYHDQNDDGSRDTSSYTYSDSTVPTDEWTHITFVENTDGTRRLYINGKLDKTEDMESSIWTNDNTLRIGAQGLTSRRFNGQIEEVRIYSRALNQSEIKGLMNQGGFSVGKEETGTGGKVLDLGFTKQNDTHVFDLSGNNNHGKPQNGASQETAVHCKVGRCYSFDGDNDYVDIVDKVGDGQSGITVTLWIKADQLNGDTLSGHADGSQLIASTDTDDAWLIGEGSGELDFYVDNGAHQDLITSGLNLQTDTWYHIAASYNGSTQKLYVNGVEEDNRDAGSGSIIDPGNNQYIGNAAGRGWGESFDGKIDQVKVFDRALSQQEIVENTQGLSSAGAVLDMRFDSAGGDHVEDFSAHDNHGTLHPNESWGPNWTDGIQGNALEFDSVDDSVIVSHDESLYVAKSNHTIAGWVEIDDLSEHGGVAMVNDRTASRNHESAVIIGGNTLKYTRGNGTDFDEISLSPAPAEDEWIHFAVKREGDTVQWYLNGEAQNSGTLSISDNEVMDDGDSYLFGHEDPADWAEGSGIDGSLDRVRVFPYAVSASKIKQFYRRGAARFGSSERSEQDPGRDGLVLDQDFDRVETCGQSDTLSCPSGMSGDVAVDGSGEANHGDLNGPTVKNGQECKAGRCLMFDGSNDLVEVNDDSSLNFTSETTWSAWIKVNASGISGHNSGRLLTKNPNDGYGLQLQTDEDPGFGVHINKGGSYNWWSISGLEDYYGRWTHLAFVFDNNEGNAYFYQDGVLIDSRSTTTDFNNSAGPLVIGNWEGGGRPFGGKIDELRLYNSSLSKSEIWSLYAQGRDRSGTGMPGPVGWWRFDEETSTAGDVKDYGQSPGLDGNGQTVSISEVSFDSPGWYKVHYGASWDSISAGSRHIMRNWLSKNGAAVTPSETRCYIRLDSAVGDSCSNSATALVNVNEGDTVELRGTKLHGSNGQTITAEDDYLYAEKVNNPVAQVYDSTGGQNYDGGTITVNMDTSTRTDSIYSFDSSNDYLQVNEDAWYRVYYSVNNHDTNQGNRQTIHSWLRLNGNALPQNPVDSYSYTRYDGVGDQNHQTGTALLNLNANDYIQLRQEKWVKQSSGESLTLQDLNWVILEKIENGNVFQIRESSEQRVNAGDTDTVEFNEVDVDGDRYDYLGQGQIAVNETGWYELSYNLNWDDENAGGRHNVFSWIERNGEKVVPTEQRDYSRGCCSGRGNSNTVSNIQKMEDGDILELKVNPVGGYIDVFANSSLSMSPVRSVPGSAEKNHGNPEGDPVWTSGKVGNALDFDGNDDYVELSNIVTMEKEGAAFSWWMKPDGDGGIFNYQGGTGGSTVSHLELRSSGTTLFAETKSNCNYFNFGGMPDARNSWKHYTIVFDSSKAHLYINGKYWGEATNYGVEGGCGGTSVSKLVDDVDIRFLGPETYQSNFNGKLDDVRIYPYALTGDQVKTVMNQGAGNAG